MAPARTSLDTYKQSFREYLRETQVVASDGELEQLMALLHEPLPVSFRVNLSHPDAQRVMRLLETELQFPSNEFFHDGKAVNPPSPIAWYPLPNVAWQLDCGRVALSKSAPKHAAVKAFHSCLLDATDAGTIDRQEAVSMLPVLFLDVAPGQRVLDMCASPGSKTTQALDFLLADKAPTAGGMVVANDLDKKRAYMLVHRLTRNTLRHAVVTCGSGITFPGLYDAETAALQTTNVFDRVLCDVPCSGDGTLRKNQTLWKEWHIGQGLTLHATQLALAMRGAALLRVGGLMVYSTCSFNAVENEAVVAELLRRCDGALELVDVTDKLPALRYRRGRSTWPVGWRSKSKSTHKGHIFTKDSDASASLHDWYHSYSDLPAELRGQRVLRSMFPPASDSAISRELEKSLRLVPIDQNSGGFFIAVFRKTRDLPGGESQCGLPALAEELDVTPPSGYVCKLCNESGHLMKLCTKYVPETEYADESGNKARPAKKARVDGAKAEAPRETLYRPISDDAWTRVEAFYGITDASLRSRLWCRSDTAATINYVDDVTAKACLAGDALEIVNTGLKVLSKVSERGETFYRPTEEAVGFIDAFFSKRVVRVEIADIQELIGIADIQELIGVNAGEDKKRSAHTPFASLSPAAQSALQGLAVGPAVLRASEEIAVNVWVGNGAVLPRVSKPMKRDVELALQRHG
ncbi:hypothetical protein ATCC90586_000193 [Pythium insidiosum]|nr:hypothetical protein ATCC90586_000193 [Pythium insidiosum]